MDGISVAIGAMLFVCGGLVPVGSGAPSDVSVVEKTVVESPYGKDTRQVRPATALSKTDFSDTLVIGDSVVSGAVDAVRAALPGVTVDADPGRTFETGGAVSGYDESDGMIESARRNAGRYARYVIECGINDAGLTDDMVAQFAEALGPNCQICLVNQFVTNNVDSTEQTDSVMRKACRERGWLLADWRLVADESMLLDNCHLNDTGAARFAETIRLALVSAI